MLRSGKLSGATIKAFIKVIPSESLSDDGDEESKGEDEAENAGNTAAGGNTKEAGGALKKADNP
jgi:hypothetical protein